ncbi:hypothetical protein AK812_SmicGene1584 [Symbiodinium microadriaticum]|uniref:Uncharacterized protein n=1 Tax=Symbiodinium microadriaticum TaxID=2951 RepID=A0A1Q9F3T6_SYMMI|nr:hypothetical protein AK812_SmicGene1584 [Symbiodinium microadriaticum]
MTMRMRMMVRRKMMMMMMMMVVMMLMLMMRMIMIMIMNTTMMVTMMLAMTVMMSEKLSWEFSQFLAKLLVSSASSIDLKVSSSGVDPDSDTYGKRIVPRYPVCGRHPTSSKPSNFSNEASNLLDPFMLRRNIHLKAYATVTLVNIVRRHESRRGWERKKEEEDARGVLPASLVSIAESLDADLPGKAPAILAENLGIKDDDLPIYYTLMLITNLTKPQPQHHYCRSTAHRFALKKSGVVSELLQRIIPLMPGKGRFENANAKTQCPEFKIMLCENPAMFRCHELDDEGLLPASDSSATTRVDPEKLMFAKSVAAGGKSKRQGSKLTPEGSWLGVDGAWQ